MMYIVSVIYPKPLVSIKGVILQILRDSENDILNTGGIHRRQKL